MECNKDEAIRAKEMAERKMVNNDFEGARKIALKAQKLFPGLDNISQLLAVCDVHCSAQKKINDVLDFYGILKLEKFADEATIKKQYRKLALVLHPDKNQFAGAEAAFKLIGEANMILSDKGKRYLHDNKCREPAKPSVPKAQNHQGNQNSNAGMQSDSKFFNAASSNGKPSFSTYCPFCKIKYMYYRDLLNKRITCQKCSQLFTAIDLGAYQSAQPTPSVHPGMHKGKPEFNTGGPASSQQEEAGKQKKAKVEPTKAEPSFIPFAYQGPQSTRTGDAKVGGSVRPKTVKNGSLKAKCRKEGVAATKETGGNPIDVCDSNDGNVQKRSRKRVQVSNSEETVDYFTPEKRSRLRKLSSDAKDNQKEQKAVPEAEFKNVKGKQKEPKVSANGSMQKDKIKESVNLKEENGHTRSNSDSGEDKEAVFHQIQDLEFSNFDEDKEAHCFAVDQIWAVYDLIDSMPRFYAQIKKVYASGFRVRISWLEAEPENNLERTWAEEGLPVACGRFKRGDSEDTRDRLMFSHQVSYDKGSKKFPFVIYPRKGEIWALFKEWDIKWSSDPKSHLKYNFEIVEVLSDFDNDNGVLVSYMVKVEGFVSLFQKTSRARLAELWIPRNELLRFSHRIPSKKLTGKERENVPIGSCELDNAALPDDLDQFYFLNNVKVNPEHVPNQSGASCPKSPEAKANIFVRGAVRKSPRGLNSNSKQSNGTESKSNIATSSKSNESFCQDDNMNTKFNGEGSHKIIHDFNLDKQNWKFEKGQIWALSKSVNGNLGCYAQIKKIENSPPRLHVNLLELCDASRPNAFGLYKACSGAVQILQKDRFIFLVKAELNGKTTYNIYPREKEIWVLYDTQDAKCTFPDVDAGDCEIVEVVKNNEDVVKVLSLSRVPGYKSLFTGLGKVSYAELDRFFYRIPAFCLTEELDGDLRVCWELDLAEFPGLLPS